MSSFRNGNLARSFSPESLAVVGREFDGLFDQLFGAPKRSCESGSCGTSSMRAPIHVWEKDAQLHIQVDLPGVAKQDVGVTFDDGAVLITAERKMADLGEHKSWHNSTSYGQFQHRFAIGEGYNPDSIEAVLNEGVLHVTVSKKPDVQPKKVEVK